MEKYLALKNLHYHYRGDSQDSLIAKYFSHFDISGVY
jgi:hypothetical protein